MFKILEIIIVYIDLVELLDYVILLKLVMIDVFYDVVGDLDISGMFNGWLVRYFDIEVGLMFDRLMIFDVVEKIKGDFFCVVILGLSGVGKIMVVC